MADIRMKSSLEKSN